MTFTYVLGSADPTEAAIAEVRMEIGDTVEDSGVLPNEANLQDEEIAVLYTREGQDVMRTVAAACELLARRWAGRVDFRIADYAESLSQAARDWAVRALELREQHGYTRTTGAISAGVLRQDGYSTDVSSDQVSGDWS
jgi:hypothetical protein